MVIQAAEDGKLPAQYDIRKNSRGLYDVRWRTLYTQKELAALLQGFLEKGLDDDNAQIDLWTVSQTYINCNPENPEGHPLERCLEFSASYVAAGDVITIDGLPFVVNRDVKQELSSSSTHRAADVVFPDGPFGFRSTKGSA